LPLQTRRIKVVYSFKISPYDYFVPRKMIIARLFKILLLISVLIDSRTILQKRDIKFLDSWIQPSEGLDLLNKMKLEKHKSKRLQAIDPLLTCGIQVSVILELFSNQILVKDIKLSSKKENRLQAQSARKEELTLKS